MSRPLIWNGSTWKDPAFQVAPGVWKAYDPPKWNRVMCNAQFAAGAEGFYCNSGGPETGWVNAEGGYIRNSNPPGFMTGMYMGVNEQSAGQRYKVADLSANVGHFVQVRILERFRTLAGFPFTGVVMSDSFNVGGATWEQQRDSRYIEFGPPGWDSGWYWRIMNSATPIKTPDWYGWGHLTIENGIYTGPLGDPATFIGWQAWAAVEVWDLTTGQLLMDLGDPGWEPRIKRADGSWK